jgi:ankyrin repeat protein
LLLAGELAAQLLIHLPLCRTGETALHYAVRSGDKKVVSMLVDRGINIHLSGILLVPNAPYAVMLMLNLLLQAIKEPRVK